jgi:excisionase family DNA binding protein
MYTTKFIAEFYKANPTTINAAIDAAIKSTHTPTNNTSSSPVGELPSYITTDELNEAVRKSFNQAISHFNENPTFYFQMLTVKKVSELLAQKPATIRQWIANGTLIATKPHGCKDWLISSRRLNVFLTRNQNTISLKKLTNVN